VPEKPIDSPTAEDQAHDDLADLDDLPPEPGTTDDHSDTDDDAQYPTDIPEGDPDEPGEDDPSDEEQG
jgi:hypothetical protein